jgi:hypothetical protein
MFDLLIYCHAFARMRYPEHFTAATGFGGMLRSHCARYVMPMAFRRRTVIVQSNRDFLCGSLDRLDLYLTSPA